MNVQLVPEPFVEIPHDLANDLVFRDAADNNRRSLSGVMAHEVTHVLEHEHITVDDLFDREIDVDRLADAVLKSL